MVSQAMEKGKIGRHGLGFNSIFNITDLPSILSGESLGDFEHKPKNRRRYAAGLVAKRTS